jgi:peptidoglycan glycosyltransferase
MFGIMALSAFYWSAWAADDLTQRKENPRRVEAEQRIRRGTIFDRSGTPLVSSIQAGVTRGGDPIWVRAYPEATRSYVSVIGYSTLKYGVSGAEEAYNTLLRGENSIDPLSPRFRDLIHKMPQGNDLKLTLDLPRQIRLYTLISTIPGVKRGALVVIEVPSGAIRAMISLPSFFPGELDAQFESLRSDPSAPLINRALQGVYQPGGALHPVILSAILSERREALESLVSSQPLTLQELTIPCLMTPPNAENFTLPLREALIYGCPRPFAESVVTQRTTVQTTFDSFGLAKFPILEGFRTASGLYEAPPPLYAFSTDGELLRQQGAGQGALRVTPLQMAVTAGVFANHGGSVTPYILEAVRSPSEEWRSRTPTTSITPVAVREIADTVSGLMRESVLSGAAHAANQGSVKVHGLSSFAYSGRSDQQPQGIVWFIGFAEQPNGTSLAVAVALEETLDHKLAAQIGGQALTP